MSLPPENTPRAPGGNSRTRVPVRSHPDAMVLRAHVAVADLTDPDAPVYADPRNMLRAGDLTELDISCPHCKSRELVEPGYRLVTAVTGHEPHCPVWTAVLAAVARAA